MEEINIVTVCKAALLSGLLACGDGLTAERHDVVVRNATVIDVESGEPQSGQSIAIDGRNITFVGKDAADSHVGKKEIDAAGRYAIPGLWDMHVHIEGKDLVEDNLALFPVYLAYGITTVRDMASDLGEQVLAWRGEVDAGKVTGPRIVTAGRKIEGIDSVWKDDLEVANEAEMRVMMDLLDSYNVDFVKVTENTLSAELFIATVEEAQRRGYKVSGHVPHGATIEQVVSSGQSSIEHAVHMLRLGSVDEKDIAKKVRSGVISKSAANEHYWRSFDQEAAVRAYERIAGYGTYLTPTLIGGRQLAYLDEVDHENDPFRRYLTQRFMAPYAARSARVMNESPNQRQQRKAQFKQLAAQMPLLQEAGINLIAGSDSAPIAAFVYPGLALHEELQIWQDAGLAPLQILQAATINGARFLGEGDDSGTIAAGKTADLVLLRQNPLDNIAATLSIETVIVRGQVFDRETLDEMLEKAASDAAALDTARLTSSRDVNSQP